MPVINVKDIQDGFIDLNTINRVSVRETNLLERSKVSKGDLLIATKGGTFKVAVVDESVEGFVISANLIALTLSDKVKPEVVAAYLNSSIGSREINKRAGGAALKGLNTKLVMEIPVPLISMEKQEELYKLIKLTQEYNSSMLEEVEKRKQVLDAIIIDSMQG